MALHRSIRTKLWGKQSQYPSYRRLPISMATPVELARTRTVPVVALVEHLLEFLKARRR